jgi:DNA-binding HxlR family transcriptional regulator
MRNQRPRFDERIAACLKESGTLGFAALLTATAAPSNQTLSRNLRRMRREGRVERTILPTYPPRVLYRLVDPAEAKSGNRLIG